MKKQIILLMVLASGSASATAQTTAFDIYGVVDSALIYESGSPNGSVTKVSGGASSNSRLGFRGTEPLTGGLSAVFVLESGFNLDDGTLNAGGGLFGRQAFVGLSGVFGTLTAGRQYSLLYDALNDVGDPFQTGTSGTSDNVLQTGGTRVNNAVRYASPAYGGFSVYLMAAPGEVPGRARAGRHIAAELAYNGGPLAGRLIYTKVNDTPASPATVLDTTRIVTALASWQLSSVKLHAGYARNKNSNGGMDSRDLIGGITLQSGPNRVVGSMIRHHDRTMENTDVDQYAAGAYHALSKRTEIYFAYSKMRRKNAHAARTFFVGTASDSGSGDRGLNLGITHTF